LTPEISVLGVSGCCPLLGDVNFVRVETPYGLLIALQGLALRKQSVQREIVWTLKVERVVAGGMNGKEALGRSG